MAVPKTRYLHKSMKQSSEQLAALKVNRRNEPESRSSLVESGNLAQRSAQSKQLAKHEITKKPRVKSKEGSAKHKMQIVTPSTSKDIAAAQGKTVGEYMEIFEEALRLFRRSVKSGLQFLDSPKSLEPLEKKSKYYIGLARDLVETNATKPVLHFLQSKTFLAKVEAMDGSKFHRAALNRLRKLFDAEGRLRKVLD